jgi:hypothetical protein
MFEQNAPHFFYGERMSLTGVPKMFEQNAPHFFYGERMSLTGVPGADDEFRFHPVEMGAGVGNDTIIAQCGIAITLDRDNRMRPR